MSYSNNSKVLKYSPSLISIWAITRFEFVSKISQDSIQNKQWFI